VIRRRFVFGTLMLALFVLGWWVGRGSSGDLYSNLDVFVEVLQKIQDNYVDPIKPASAVRGAIDGMLDDLDPYSQYLDEKEYASLKDFTRGEFNGIGVVVGVRNDFPTVISPIEGSPAWEAGLHSGDVILKVDGKSTAGLNVAQASELLRGAAGTPVTVTIGREGEDGERDVKLTRREIVTKSVPYAFMVGRDVGYVRLASFSEKSAAEVRNAVDRLHKEGARRFVLDLRQNPGGLLDQAVDVAEEFLPKGEMVVYTHGRTKGQDQRYYSAAKDADTGSPLAVLVDEGSASASEIVAGALQDRDRALILGRTTFGKGSVQSVFTLAGGRTALKVTTALYYTPSGRSIHKPRPRHDLETDEDAEPDSSADSVKARPQFHTRAGRVVYGGGGITPDVLVKVDSLPPLALEIERRGLAFRYANRWANTHPGAKVERELPPGVWTDFAGWLRGEKLTFDDATLAAQRLPIERALRRELARRIGGDSAAMKVVLEGDPAFARALEVLGRAARPADVFAGGVGDQSRDPAR